MHIAVINDFLKLVLNKKKTTKSGHQCHRRKKTIESICKKNVDNIAVAAAAHA